MEGGKANLLALIKCPHCRQIVQPKVLHELIDSFATVGAFYGCIFTPYVMNVIQWIFNYSEQELTNELRVKLIVGTFEEEDRNIFQFECVKCGIKVGPYPDNTFELTCCSKIDSRKFIHGHCLVSHVDNCRDFPPSYVGLNTICPTAEKLCTSHYCTLCDTHKIFLSRADLFIKYYRIESHNAYMITLLSDRWCYAQKKFFLECVLPYIASGTVDDIHHAIGEMCWGEDNRYFDEDLVDPLNMTQPPSPVSVLKRF